MSDDFILRGGTVVRPKQRPEPLDILVRSGRIAGLLEPGEAVHGASEQSVEGLHVFPGCIDAHVHFGFGEKITEYESETAYAAHGGITTIIGYLLNNDPYAEVFKREQGYAETRCRVDYAFHFSAASEPHIHELESYVRQYGVTSFKYFMNFKGEVGRYLGLDGTDDGYFYDLLHESARIGQATIICHPENIEIVERVRRRVQAQGGTTLKDWASAKPAFTEAENCVRAMYFGERTGARVYFPHLSSKLALDEVRKWRDRYSQVYAETCPQYLVFTQESELGPLGKANPPFKTREDRDALWEGIADGTIDVVGSDHTARRRSQKETNIWAAAQGFPGTATMLPVLLSEGYHKGRLSLERIAEVLTSGPAGIFGLLPRKGCIAVGSDADFTIVDLGLERVVDASELGSYADFSLYDGMKLKGWPVRTIIRGVTVMQDGRLVGAPGYGIYLPRSLPGF